MHIRAGIMTAAVQMRCSSPQESPRPVRIDAPWESDYPRIVPAKKIQVGQVWKKDDSGEAFLVTKVYNEALATYAMLRKAGAEAERPLRVKVTKAGQLSSLPGFTFSQETDDF
jgi:hypothetical protein